MMAWLHMAGLENSECIIRIRILLSNRGSTRGKVITVIWKIQRKPEVVVSVSIS